MISFYTALYFVENIFILWRYYKKEDGFIQFPFIMALASLGLTMPQLISLYAMSNIYSPKLFPALLWTMVTVNPFIVIGYEYIVNKKNKYGTVETWELNFRKLTPILFLFALLGLYSSYLYMGKQYVQSDDNVMQVFFKGFANLSFSLCVTAFICNVHSPKIKFIFIISCIPIFLYAFVIKGSRTETMIIIFTAVAYLYFKSITRASLLKKMMVVFFIVGTIFSASIAILREIMKGNINSDILSLDYLFLAFISSFGEQDTTFGLDLGNAAIAIDYCSDKGAFDYGIFQIWNNFVQDFIPNRVVGEQVKNSLFYHTGYENTILDLTNNTTVMTGYFSCFSAFSYFGFILAFLFGACLGYIWKRVRISSFFVFIHLFLLGYFAIFLSHGLYYFYNKIIYIFLFVMPLFIIMGGLKKKHSIIQ